MFCLQTDLMNHFIISEFSEFTDFFPFIHDYMATILQFLKFKFLHLIITVSGDCCFYVYHVNVHFHKKTTLESLSS